MDDVAMRDLFDATVGSGSALKIENKAITPTTMGIDKMICI